MTLSNDDLRSEREFTEELAHEAELDLDRGEVPADRVHLVYNSLGGDYRELGVLSSLLGEQQTALEQFEEAAGCYLSGIRITRERWDEISGGNRESQPSILLKGLYCSLLSGDDELIEEIGTAPAWKTEEWDDGSIAVVAFEDPVFLGDPKPVNEHLGLETSVR